ncbi:MAG: hypothetical protein ACTSV1_07825 [Alphaproteobacteria bacterium]
MTKAKARERAKAKALKKTKKRLDNADKPDQPPRPGHFDAGSQSIKGPGTNVSSKNFGAARRGSARSG